MALHSVHSIASPASIVPTQRGLSSHRTEHRGEVCGVSQLYVRFSSEKSAEPFEI